MSDAPPSLTDRLFSGGYYLGLGPLIGPPHHASSNLFRHHHFKQAMGAFFLGLSVLLTVCIFELTECVIVIGFPGFVERLADQFGSAFTYLDKAELLLFAVPALLWFALLGLAIAGSSWPMPLLTKLSQNPGLIRFSCAANLILLLLVPVTVGFALWATSFTRTNVVGAKVYFLYDEGIAVPRWGYAMGLSRLSLQAKRNWGKGSTVLDRLNRETLHTALACGRVVILATHGDAGYVATYFAPEVLGVWPADSGAKDETGGSHFLRMGIRGVNGRWSRSANVKLGEHLQLVYLFGCNAGARSSQWKEHVAPARVVAYDRFSTVLDHALWFALTGPAELKKVR